MNFQKLLVKNFEEKKLGVIDQFVHEKTDKFFPDN